MGSRIYQTLMTLSVLWGLGFAAFSQANTLEVFAKASASKNYTDQNSYTLSVSGATGLAILLIPQVRIEGRYTVVSSLQNRLDVGSPSIIATLNDIKTETNIYSVGLDIDILNEKYAIQPFVFLGAGYIESNRSYYVTPVGSPSATLVSEPTTQGISANVGAGIKIRIAKSISIELEAYGYGLDPQKPNPLVNLYGNAGIRIFI
jgi:hypothetical protein